MNLEAGKAFRFLGRDVDPVDARSPRPLAAELDQALDRVALALEYRLDRTIGPVAHPACDGRRLRSPPERLAEEDTLDVTLDDDAAALHGRRLMTAVRSEFVHELAATQIGATFNQYAGSPLLQARLASYLHERRRAQILLVGEAAGYRGARVSGLPFTSERQLTGTGPAEATATIVQRVLVELGIAGDVLLWNLVPTHPGTERSNRAPTQHEIEHAEPFLAELATGRRLIAVGRLAHSRLGGPYVRHPSHGGGAQFRANLVAALG